MAPLRSSLRSGCPGRSAKTLRGPIRLRHFREQRITVYELAA
jgi:hypothetical protein